MSEQIQCERCLWLCGLESPPFPCEYFTPTDSDWAADHYAAFRAERQQEDF